MISKIVLLSLDRSYAMVGLAAEDLNKNGAIYYLLTPPHTEAAKDLKKTERTEIQNYAMKYICMGDIHNLNPQYSVPARTPKDSNTNTKTREGVIT